MHCQCVFIREADEQQVNFRCLKTACNWPSNSQVAVWFTFCTTLELFRHRWKDVLQPSQIHRHKIPSFPVHFRCFATPRQKSSEKAPCARKRLTPSCYWLKLMTSKTFTKWEVCTFRTGASRCGASFDRFRERNVDVLLSVNFRRLKTGWSSNSQIAVWFTFCTTLELYQHRWMDVLQPWQIHRHKIPSFSVHFRCFTTPRQKSSEKAHCAQKPLTPFRDWLKLITNKTFTKWEVCMFRIGASRGGASFDRFRERNVMFFSLSTSGVWKQVDPRIHR